jgi:cytoskeleton protein RodZ
MSSVGAYLRGLREQQGMSVDELSRATRVLSHYLEALEAEDLRRLPAPVFTKGFIRAYCQSVGVAPDEALRLYDRMGVPAPDLSKVPVNAVRVAAGAQPHPRQVVFEEPDYLPVTPGGLPTQGEPRDGRTRGTLLISFILLVVLGAAFFAVTLAIQSGRDGASEQSAQIAQLPSAESTETPASAPAPPAPAESLPPQTAAPAQPAKPLPSVNAGAATPAATAPSTASASTSTAVALPGQAPVTPVAVAPRPQPAPSVQQVPGAQPAPGVQPAPRPATPPAATLPAAAPTAVAAPGSAAVAPGAASAPYRLVARTTETTWMRVRTDDGRTSEETIPANEIREWVSNGPFVITIGNAGGVSLELNGRPVPRLGASGSVITRLVLPSDNQ